MALLILPLFLGAAAFTLVAFAAIVWTIGEWIYEAWFQKKPEPNGWCPVLQREIAAGRIKRDSDLL